MRSIGYKNKILIIGYGSVAQCTLPVLFKHVNMSYTQVTVMDFIEQPMSFCSWAEKGVRYTQQKITADNMSVVLSSYVQAGDMIIDLAWNIDTLEMLHWCHLHQVLYLNTSVEEWDPFDNIHQKPILEKTLYWRQMQIRQAITTWSNHATTAIVDHGANPGLISHFTKQGLIDIAEKYLHDNMPVNAKYTAIKIAHNNKNFAHLAMHLGVKVIHCSERDMQVTAQPKKMDEFVNTWSIEGLIEEGMAPAEMGWGTHEITLPENAHTLPANSDPDNQIFLAQMGINTWVRSWIPSQEILGMVIRHGEAFGISDSLTVRNDQGNVIYRPTVHYAYMPSEQTLMSLHELRARNYQMPEHQRIMNDEIVAGEDALGALIMGHPYGAWWTGSILSIEKSRELVPHQNATTTQVAIGVVAAVAWMINNPQQGFCLPDDLPYDVILAFAKPYLGQLISIPSDWTPQKHYQSYFKENVANQFNNKNPWSFENFRFRA